MLIRSVIAYHQFKIDILLLFANEHYTATAVVSSIVSFHQPYTASTNMSMLRSIVKSVHYGRAAKSEKC